MVRAAVLVRLEAKAGTGDEKMEGAASATSDRFVQLAIRSWRDDRRPRRTLWSSNRKLALRRSPRQRQRTHRESAERAELRPSIP